ncbi:MAG: polyisoprenoid-binding protein [Chloroflexota bacterium]|nr:MAG: polyisoprenoid-binding protein [Chloroflexota bacterium]
MSWQIDPAHSQIQFSARHMMISNVRGRFDSFTGSVEFDEADPTRSSVEVQIDAASINTREPQRDAHLKSPDFLDAEKYPYLHFKSTRIEKVDDTHGRIVGDLTIHGVTRPVVLSVEYAGQAKSPWGTVSAGFDATTKISRKDWGLTWNHALETGGFLVGDELTISIELEIVKQAESVTEAARA